MKIGEAQKIYQGQRAELLAQKRKLLKQKDELEKKTNATVNGKELFANEAATLELSIDRVTEQFDKNQEVLDNLSEQHALVWNTEVARQQKDAAQDAALELAKIMEVARRIARGAKVPGKDEQKLMEYSMELYMASKNAAMLKELEEERREKYDSLWEDDDNAKQEEYDPQGKADNAEVSVDLPEIDMSVVDAEAAI